MNVQEMESALMNLPNEWAPEGVRGKCICDSGYSGNGDFLNLDGMNCSVNHTVVKNWWFVLGMLYTGVFLYSNMITIEFVLKQKKDRFKAIINSPLQKAITYVSIECLLRMIEGAIRVESGGKAVIGNSLPITLIEAAGGILFWGHLAIEFIMAWMRMIISSAKMNGSQGEIVKNRMELMKKELRIFKWWVRIVFLSTVGTHFTPNPEIAKYLVIGYFVGMSIASIYLVNVCALPVARLFKNILGEANPEGTDMKIQALQDKVAVFAREARNNGISNTLTCVLFLCPFMWAFISYQVLFGWTLAIPILLAASIFIRPSKANPNRRKSKVSPTSSTIVEV
jgi:hypothetical protein